MVVVARPGDGRHPAPNDDPRRIVVKTIGLDDEDALADAFAGCHGVAHCAGINRRVGAQTFERVHVAATRRVVAAAERAGATKVVLISFLRARADTGWAYHESKWRAEQIVRESGLDYTVLKCGVIYGRGDHMLDHLSLAMHSFPVFVLVGFKDQLIRPVAVVDLVRILCAALVDNRVSRQTIAVVGPQTLTLAGAVKRVADVMQRRPVYVRWPIAVHLVLGWLAEKLMAVPIVSVAQVRILSEGVAEPAPPCDPLPADLTPVIAFDEQTIRRGLPGARRLGLRDLRWLAPRRGP